ncbi:MAG TPA: winged helix-turn-helix domain-containing protein [Candidatus Limnocylindrales bacterium]|nr:winged helix-turn-helix domain-containing protein [Candidatus Limnocylindrales bacterium]
MESNAPTRRVHFGAFDVDLRSGEVHKHGIRLKLQDQPFQILALLLEHSGDVVTREELHGKLWPSNTFVDFDTGLNSAIKKLRDVLGDSAEEPRYIETLPRRGYRFIAHIENGDSPASVAVEQPSPSIAPPHRLWNSFRFVITATFAVILAVAAFASWRIFFLRPVLTGSDVILLANFVNKTGDPIFDNSLDKALEVKLGESPFLSILPDADVRRTMRTMRHEPSERVTQELGIEICKRQGLKAVVVPEIAAFGSKYLITLEAIDARTQKSIARRQEQAEKKKQVIASLGKAGSQLRRQLGESLSSVEKYDAPLDLATTSSLEALQAYRTGQSLFRSGKQREAIPFFERAVDLDPLFASAYAVLGTAYFSISDDQAARKNFTKAYQLKDAHLTQEENFQTTALYHSYISGNLDKEIAVLLLYQQVYPRSVFAANRLAIAYAHTGRTEEALQKFNWAIDHSPVPSAQYYSNAAQALMTLGRFDDAKQLLTRWQQIGSLNPFQKDVLYRIAFFENDPATMDRLAAEFPADDIHWLEFQMQFAFLRGDLRKLRSLSDTLVTQLRHAGELENAANELALHAQLESLLGSFPVARGLCLQAGSLGKDSSSELWRCAEALGDAGDLPRAEAFVAKLDQMDPEDTIEQKVQLPLMRSIIERERGNAAKAANLLGPAEQYGWSLDVFYRRAQACLAAGKPAEAAVELENLLAHRGWGWWPVYSPLAKLGLARAYAGQGKLEKSRKAYDEFFTTWKDADPNIPILRQAKADYKKLGITTAASVAASAKPQ